MKHKFTFWWNNPNKNPLWWWQKVRHQFKKPPCHLHIGKYQYLILCDPVQPRLCWFAVNGLGWKLKFDSPRFEYMPNIAFKFFAWEIRLYWSWKISDDSVDIIYWETILDIVVCHKPIRIAINNNTWTDRRGCIENVETLNLLKYPNFT